VITIVNGCQISRMRLHTTVVGLSCFVVLLYIYGASAQAATRYVDARLKTDCVAGNYSLAQRDCSGADGDAYTLLSRAINLMTAGDTTVVRAGTYTESLFDFPVCTASLPCLIKRYTTEEVIIRPPTAGAQGDIFRFFNARHVTLDGLIIDGSAVTGTLHHLIRFQSGASRLTIMNSELKNAPAGNCIFMQDDTTNNIRIINNKIHRCGDSNQHHGIYLRASDIFIQGNEIFHISGYGIHNFFKRGESKRNIIERNYIHDNGVIGILAGSGSDTIVRHNIVFNNGKGGIRIRFFDPKRIVVYNNTIYGNRGGCIEVMSDRTGTPDQSVIKNNICRNNQNNAILNSGLNSIISHNITQDANLKSAPARASRSAENIAGEAVASMITPNGFSTTITNNLTLTCHGPCTSGADIPLPSR
jgi:parallel beta-helix repeat protein